MTDESALPLPNNEEPSTESSSRPRRNPAPRPKKAPKPIAKTESDQSEGGGENTPSPSKFPEFPNSLESEESRDPAPLRTDWPEPEAPSSGSPAPESTKRKRRRKKGKGNPSQNPAPQTETASTDSEVSTQTPPQHRPQPPTHRSKLDPDQLAGFAWKIYLSEVSEEGVALVGDTDAKELARRCFRLAEIFLEEQARRR